MLWLLARAVRRDRPPVARRELPELTEAMLERGTFRMGGRPVSPNPRKQITIRLPADVIEKWRATGPGWMTRMAARRSKLR